MHRRSRLGTLAGLALVLVGCTSAIKVAPYEGADDGSCDFVADAWPARVAGQEPVVTAVESTSVAAWGEPAIIARCGGPIPGPTTDQCLDIDGVDWVATELDDGVQFTTYGRSPALEVLVPDDYEPQALLMPAFTDVAMMVDQGDRRCS
ncbi:DUF3515 domain-containing protein [Ornithinimicrobium sp. Arc0846-15]|nr:DUF3515 domain-containing protein [Ornithinimicrobium laminariae]